ncbi:hypothetical protein [Alicyclobacillus fastidiosus]|uniref:DUF4825 domain-containing protein n=1 Tax=Alicyclobacillus fastidiosus TaxID=392011 RepID=A0ABV5AKF7_9BACL|nr:hypothetical protein [Alicyclobacillus fastidiosus]WEH08449.1 hypothetical protein PYS47_17385 [Alicyclobacillus fastidiosus]
MKKSLFYIIGGLLICSFALNSVQLRRTESNNRSTLNAVMVSFAGPINTATEGYKLKTPEQIRIMSKMSLLSQSVGALNGGMTTLDAMGIPHQYSYNILIANESAVGALQGGYSSTDQQKLDKWVDTESSLLRIYETQQNLPNIPLLKKTFKEIYDAIPIHVINE